MKEKLKRFWEEWEIKTLLHLFAALAILCVLVLLSCTLGEDGSFEWGYVWVLFLVLCITMPVVAGVFFVMMSEKVKRKREQHAREKSAREYYAREHRRDEEERSAFYSEEELSAVDSYLAEAFGDSICKFYDADTQGIRLDVAVAEPEEERNFYTLSTVGMGAHRMSVPPPLAEKNRSFAELTMLLPPDWDLMNDTWPFRILRGTARLPFTEFEHIGLGSAYGGAYMEGTGFYGVLAGPAFTRGAGTRLMLPSGKIVNFYLLLPIYADEWDYMERMGSLRLWNRFARRFSGDFTVRPGRRSCVGERWFEEDIEPFAWNRTAEGFELVLDDVSWRSEIIEQYGYPANGHGWREIAERFAVSAGERPEASILFDGTEARFAARCRDEETLRSFALAFRFMCGDDGALNRLLKEDD